MLGFCCPGTLLLSAKYNLFCSRRCLKIGNMPSSERFFRQTKPIWRRNTWCIPRKIGNVWRKKSRRLGMLTIFKRALSQVKTWLRVFLWREGLTLTYKAKYIEKFCEIHSQINLFVAVEPRNHNHKPEKEKGYHLLRDFLPQSMMRHCQF